MQTRELSRRAQDARRDFNRIIYAHDARFIDCLFDELRHESWVISLRETRERKEKERAVNRKVRGNRQ